MVYPMDIGTQNIFGLFLLSIKSIITGWVYHLDILSALENKTKMESTWNAMSAKIRELGIETFCDRSFPHAQFCQGQQHCKTVYIVRVN